MDEKTGTFTNNPIIVALIAALRLLGAITRTNAEALLQLSVVDVNLTGRERAAVLDAFPESCPGQHLQPECGPTCQGRTARVEELRGFLDIERQAQMLMVCFQLLSFDPAWLDYPIYAEHYGVSCNDATCPCDRMIVNASGFLTPRQLIQVIALHREHYTSSEVAKQEDKQARALGSER